jgi:hypothetical protein
MSDFNPNNSQIYLNWVLSEFSDIFFQDFESNLQILSSCHNTNFELIFIIILGRVYKIRRVAHFEMINILIYDNFDFD